MGGKIWGICRSALLGIGLFLFLSERVMAVSLTLVGARVLPFATEGINSLILTGNHSFGYGGGLLIDYKMVKKLSFQMGALYVPRGAILLIPEMPTEITFTTLTVPFLFRFFFYPALSAGMGVYYSRGLGSVASSSASGATVQPYGANSYLADDLGYVANVALQIKLLLKTAFIFDVRYQYGILNLSQTSGVTFFLRDYQMLMGLRFGD